MFVTVCCRRGVVYWCICVLFNGNVVVVNTEAEDDNMDGFVIFSYERSILFHWRDGAGNPIGCI